MKLMTVNGNRSRPLFAGCLVLPLAVWAFDCYFLYNAQNLYDSLQKPVFAPPYPILIPAAAALSLLMGYASYRVAVHKPGRRGIRVCLVLYAAHLVTSFAWPVIFFGFENPGLALYVLFALLILLVACVYSFVRVDAAAAYLLLPAFAFWCYVTAVNYGIVLFQRMQA